MHRIVLVPALALSVPAFAFGPGPHHEPSPEEREARLNHALDEIDATDEQRSAIRVFLEDTAPKLRELHEEGRLLREEFQTVFLTSEVVDRGEVEVLRLDAVDLFDRMTSTGLDLMVDVANVLTVDQRQTLHELKEARHERFRDRVDAWRSQRDEQ
jgi:Spy/CpxP family protein refolding chaperone